ncbi:MAG: ABC transporter ATP-binding protein [Candidatus Zixiibacteriota bacterium]|nr:MAG: ABC transporter ATP-binding protein [candidate division Zixibacteria bacterium]
MTSEFYEDEQFTQAEADIGTRRAFGSLLPFLKAHRKRLSFSFGLLAVTTVLSLVWPILLKEAIDGPLRTGVYSDLVWIAVVIAFIQILTVVLQYVLRVKLEVIGQDVMLELKRRLFDHILSLDVAFFDRNPVGRLMARVESDTESLRLLFTNTVLLVVADLVLIAGLYGVLFYYNWRMAAILTAVIPVIGLLTYIFHKVTTHRFLEVRKRMAEVTATLTEFLHGMSIIQIFHRGAYARRKVFDANKAKFTEDVFVNIAVCVFFNFVFLFEYVKIGLVLILGSGFGLTAGLMVLFLVNIWRSFEPIFRTSEQLANFQKAVAGAKRIFALLATESRLIDPDKPVAWPGLKDAIRFENVSFSYNDDENYVLKNVSFEIKAGHSAALAGVTGGGKTTVISLMLRLYDPQKGRITIDGVDIRDMAKTELRRRFALVLQDIFLFPGDVTANIGLESDDITQERIAEVARVVAADRFIEKLPDGYKTEVSEKGANFSRGERQLLSFARALAFDPEVLVLDEATSSVDPETERTIQSSLKELMAGRTSLVIAHRLSTILDVDQILVIRRGEIVERGTHAELLLQNGYYSRLFHLQFRNRNGVASNV